MNAHTTLREEWRSRTRYGKAFLPLLAVARFLVGLLFLVEVVLAIGVILLLWVLFKGPEILVERASRLSPAVYAEEVR